MNAASGRRDDVIECLKLKDDDVAADLGCGAGYFSLKLAPKVAEHGSVLAEGILGQQARVVVDLTPSTNLRIVHCGPNEPLPEGGVRAVL